MTEPLKRQRDTSATRRRVDNLRRLIEEFGARNMMDDEISAFLEFSASGTRKYIREMHDFGVIEVGSYAEGNDSWIGKPVYQLVQNRVAEFLDAISGPGGKIEQLTKKKTSKRMQQIDGRHFHIMADDQSFAIRLDRTPVMRDFLVAALFGPAGNPQQESK